MNAKQIKESEGDEAIARMAAECATDEPVRQESRLVKDALFAVRYGTGRISCGRPPQRTVKEILDEAR